jgi:EpsI family protein
MIARIFILSACLLLGAGVIARASRTEQVPARERLAQFPSQIAGWQGQNTEPFSKEVLDVLGVDDYLTRFYHQGRSAVGLYIGYYESQRQGDSIHSPLNCLPGAGWQPLSKSYLPISVVDTAGNTSEITVNRYVIEKGLDQQVVLYWYQSHGRVIANEYRSKVFMVFDAARLNRSDAALVRVTSPRIGSGAEAETAADGRAVDFVKAMFPSLGRFLPS